MTLLVALKGNDGLALAADSRGTFGDPRGVTAQNDSQQKAHALAPHVAVLQAGAGEVGTLLIEEASRDIAARSLDGVTPVMAHLREHCRGRYQDWFPSVPPIVPPQQALTGQAATRPDLVFLVAGYELSTQGAGDPKLYQLGSTTDFSPMLHDYGFAVAGVAQYALYLLNRLYEPDRSVQELTALAVYVITETASQDGKVGGPVNVIRVTPKDGCQVLERSDVDEVMASNEARSKSLRDSFYERRDQ
jgi:20S proteasome alpha/beta subunit